MRDYLRVGVHVASKHTPWGRLAVLALTDLLTFVLRVLRLVRAWWGS